MQLNDEFDVPVPIGAAFRFYSDPSRWGLPTHAPGVKIEPSGPLKVGDVVTASGRGLKRAMKMEVTALDPPTAIGIRMWEDGRPRRYAIAAMELSPAAPAVTSVSSSLDLHWGWLMEIGMRVARPFIGWAIRRGSRKQREIIVEMYREGHLDGHGRDY